MVEKNVAREYTRYTKDQLEQIVSQCINFADVARAFGKAPVGGTLTHIKLMCVRLGIDISHMTGVPVNRPEPSSKKSADHLLKMGLSTDHRISASRLRWRMVEKGIEYKCNCCGIVKWNSQQLVLEIDHIDGRYWNNTIENLQFLCPNCHSMKPHVARVAELV